MDATRPLLFALEFGILIRDPAKLRTHVIILRGPNYDIVAPTGFSLFIQ
jgi:hypothetical protein